MAKLTRDDLYSLEEYDRLRPEFRAKVMAHKKTRVAQLGPDATLHFEDRLVMQYQIQEMLRAERIFSAEGIEEELEAYNPLIPDGTNFKATMMIEFPEREQRREALAKMIGIEERVWVRVGDMAQVMAIADEDLERATEEKTSSVHFLRFELSPEMIAAAKTGAPLSLGVDHDAYRHSIDPLPEPVRASLAGDLE
jgi:hypothetical protein